MGNGWLSCILDSFKGMDTYVLDLPDSNDGTMYKIMLTVTEGELNIIAATYNVDRTLLNRKKHLNLKIPAKLCPGRIESAGYVTLNENNCLHAEIKTDLTKEGVIEEVYAASDILGTAVNMAKSIGSRVLANNYAKYESIQTELLTLKTYSDYNVLDDGETELKLMMDT